MNDQGSSRSLRPFVAARLNRGEKAVWSVGTSQERDLRSDQAPWAQPLAPERWAAMPGPLSELRYSPLYRGRRPTGRRDSRNRPTRVSTRPVRGARRAVRDFARFAAAMAAGPASQDQLFARSQRRIRAAETVNTSARIQWLGIGSWALFCAALFVTLLLRPDRDAVDHGIALQEADHTLRRAIVSIPATADPMPLLSNGREITMRPAAPAPGPGG